MEDESIFTSKQSQKDVSYLNDLVIAVCINGEKLEKYEKVAIKQYGEDVLSNTKLFVEEVSLCLQRQIVTNTTKINLNYLGKKAGLSEETISKIIEHCEHQINIIPKEEGDEDNDAQAKYDGPNRFLNILSFIFPLLGWVLFFVLIFLFKKPTMAQSCAKWAFFGILISGVFLLILCALY